MDQLPALFRIFFLFATKSAKLSSSHISSCSELPIFMSSYGHEKQPTRSIIAHPPYSSATIAVYTALVLTHNVLKCHHSVSVQLKPNTSSHFSFQNIEFGVNKDIREDTVLMDRSRMHKKYQDLQEIFRPKVMLCSQKQFCNFIKLLKMVFVVWFSVKRPSQKMIEKHGMNSLFCAKHSSRGEGLSVFRNKLCYL